MYSKGTCLVSRSGVWYECGTGQKSTSHRITCICSHPHTISIIRTSTNARILPYSNTPEIQSSTFLHPSIQTLVPTNEPSQISARSEYGKRNHRFTKQKPLFPSIFPYRRQLRQTPRRCFVLMTSYESPAPDRGKSRPPTPERRWEKKQNEDGGENQLKHHSKRNKPAGRKK